MIALDLVSLYAYQYLRPRRVRGESGELSTHRKLNYLMEAHLRPDLETDLVGTQRFSSFTNKNEKRHKNNGILEITTGTFIYQGRNCIVFLGSPSSKHPHIRSLYVCSAQVMASWVCAPWSRAIGGSFKNFFGR